MEFPSHGLAFSVSKTVRISKTLMKISNYTLTQNQSCSMSSVAITLLFIAWWSPSQIPKGEQTKALTVSCDTAELNWVNSRATRLLSCSASRKCFCVNTCALLPSQSWISHHANLSPQRPDLTLQTQAFACSLQRLIPGPNHVSIYKPNTSTTFILGVLPFPGVDRQSRCLH